MLPLTIVKIIKIFSHPKFGDVTSRTEITAVKTLWVALRIMCLTHFLFNVLKCSIFLWEIVGWGDRRQGRDREWICAVAHH